MIYVFLANGFEEVEALTPVDVLRRLGCEVKTVGVDGRVITGSHGVPVTADLEEKDVVTDGVAMVILPGGWGISAFWKDTSRPAIPASSRSSREPGQRESRWRSAGILSPDAAREPQWPLPFAWANSCAAKKRPGKLGRRCASRGCEPVFRNTAQGWVSPCVPGTSTSRN